MPLIASIGEISSSHRLAPTNHSFATCSPSALETAVQARCASCSRACASGRGSGPSVRATGS
jgi:hypothetical protein